MEKTIAPSELILRPDGSLYHLHLLPGQVAENIITVGDPERVTLVSQRFDRIELKVEAREFVTHTGELNGKRLTVISTGIGTDNVDIVINELDALFNIDLDRRQVKDRLTSLNFVRLGTSGAFQPDLPLDSLLLSVAAIAADGLLPFYPGATGSQPLTVALRDHLEACGLDWPVLPRIVIPQLSEAFADPFSLSGFDGYASEGITLTAAGFYGPQGRQLRLATVLQADLLAALRDFSYEERRITNIEMETAGIYGLATALGHRSASLSVLLANRSQGTFSRNPAKTVEKMIDFGLDLLTRD